MDKAIILRRVMMKALMRYPGAKWKLADWIISFIPGHHTYVEPFFGSGAVLLNKDRSDIETVNDIDGNVVNLFKCVRDNPDELARMVYAMPYARDVYDEAWEDKERDDISAAAAFLARSNMGYGFRTCRKSGFKIDVAGREKGYAVNDWCGLPDRIMESAKRLMGVQIENRPAIEIIERFDRRDALIYCDTTYMHSVRTGGNQYSHEMSEEEHRELLEILTRHKGKVIISGYDSELYDNMLAGWERHEAVSYTQSGEKRIEVIWMNYVKYGVQMNLFDMM